MFALVRIHLPLLRSLRRRFLMRVLRFLPEPRISRPLTDYGARLRTKHREVLKRNLQEFIAILSELYLDWLYQSFPPVTEEGVKHDSVSNNNKNYIGKQIQTRFNLF